MIKIPCFLCKVSETKPQNANRRPRCRRHMQFLPSFPTRKSRNTQWREQEAALCCQGENNNPPRHINCDPHSSFVCPSIYETTALVLQENSGPKKNHGRGPMTRLNLPAIGNAARLQHNKSVWPTGRANEPCPSCNTVLSLSPCALAEQIETVNDAGRRMEQRREREERPERAERDEKPEGERDADYPDVHHTLFFILHYPCSAPLCSIMLAPRINDESRDERCPYGGHLRETPINTPLCGLFVRDTRQKRELFSVRVSRVECTGWARV